MVNYILLFNRKVITMARKSTKKRYELSTLTSVPSNLVTSARRFIQRGDAVQQLPFWGDLKERDQKTLAEEMENLAAAKLAHTAGGLAMGKALRNIKATLKPYSGAFEKVADEFMLNVRNAYRYIETYEAAEKAFPEKVLMAAVVMGLEVLSYPRKPLGKYTEAVKMLPPPQDPNDDDAVRYIRNLEQTRKDYMKAVREGKIEPKEEADDAVLRDPEVLLKNNFRGIKNALTHVPSRSRRRWMERLFGMILTQQGIGSGMRFEPEAIPEEFLQGPGRPPLPDNPHPVREAAA